MILESCFCQFDEFGSYYHSCSIRVDCHEFYVSWDREINVLFSTLMTWTIICRTIDRPFNIFKHRLRLQKWNPNLYSVQKNTLNSVRHCWFIVEIHDLRSRRCKNHSEFIKLAKTAFQNHRNLHCGWSHLVLNNIEN